MKKTAIRVLSIINIIVLACEVTLASLFFIKKDLLAGLLDLIHEELGEAINLRFIFGITLAATFVYGLILYILDEVCYEQHCEEEAPEEYAEPIAEEATEKYALRISFGRAKRASKEDLDNKDIKKEKGMKLFKKKEKAVKEVKEKKEKKLKKAKKEAVEEVKTEVKKTEGAIDSFLNSLK